MIIIDAEVGENYKDQVSKQLGICYLSGDPYQFYIVDSVLFEIYILPFALIAISLIVLAVVKTIAAILYSTSVKQPITERL
jgi:hypothetical protein